MLDAAALAYAALAVVGSTIVFAAVSAALEPLGMPALRAPFVLMVWLFVLAGALFPRLQPIGKA